MPLIILFIIGFDGAINLTLQLYNLVPLRLCACLLLHYYRFLTLSYGIRDLDLAPPPSFLPFFIKPYKDVHHINMTLKLGDVYVAFEILFQSFAQRPIIF
jgi:hypothetical protein